MTLVGSQPWLKEPTTLAQVAKIPLPKLGTNGESKSTELVAVTLWHFKLNFLEFHRGFLSLGTCCHCLTHVPWERDINAIEQFLDL